jgi:hypothetical protein
MQRRRRDRVSIDFEERPQRRPRIRTAEAVGTQGDVAVADPRPDQVGGWV